MKSEADNSSPRGTGSEVGQASVDAAEPGLQQTPRISGVMLRTLRKEHGPISSRVPSGPPPLLDSETQGKLNDCFCRLSGPSSKLDLARLQLSLMVEDRFLAERVIAVLDKDADGLVSRAEFVGGVPRLLFGTLGDKLKFAFRLHDLDGDGRLDRVELTKMMELGLREDGVCSELALVQRFVDLLMLAADRNGDGEISFSEFAKVAAQHPQVLELMAETEHSWVTSNDAPKVTLRQTLAAWGGFVANNLSACVVLTVWLLVTLLVALDGALRYQASGPYIMLARACGAALNLNVPLVLLPTARYLLSRARNVPVLRALPLDHAMAFHQWVASAIIGLSLVHTVAHLLNHYHSGQPLLSWLFLEWFPFTGVTLLLVLGTIAVFSIPKIRQSERFEWFHRAHLLYPLFLVVALGHGKRMWAWAAAPLVLFCVDRLVRRFRGQQETQLLGIEALASGVTKLTLKKPPKFAHTPGDYVYLKLPKFAAYEWHPFTISSAPAREELTFHVRSLGDFTRSVYDYAKAARGVESTHAPEKLEAYIDGPFGTASGDVTGSEVAVLVGAGIGVTPFASVLESLVLGKEPTRLKKVYFYWLNRDGAPFEWFHELLAELEQKDQARLVDIRIFMTRGRGRATSTALYLATKVASQYGDPDHVTGLRTRTNLGAPKWRNEFTRITESHPGAQVDVYFCGPPGLAWTLRYTCARLGLPFRQEHF